MIPSKWLAKLPWEHAATESQHEHEFVIVCDLQPISDFKNPPASPVSIVPIICSTTLTAEKNENSPNCGKEILK